MSNDGTHDPTIDRRRGGAVGPGDLPEGMEVGEYRVLKKIGEGGMGAVYSAIQPVIGKRVAIKVLAQHSPPIRSWCGASSTRRAPSTRSATPTSSTSSRSAGCPTSATTS